MFPKYLTIPLTVPIHLAKEERQCVIVIPSHKDDHQYNCDVRVRTAMSSVAHDNGQHLTHDGG